MKLKINNNIFQVNLHKEVFKTNKLIMINNI